ncbi:Chemotactic signal-response protein CheL (modular protein) [Candidatus Terasakiella magnetica]|uniref:Chemotactic signal-response protein CheL (Modular protein) n=1 Tax=Candidatus Terasakiella magnetica TaxID=1867952 RepID=A0A1C3RKU3_9PROT|nr:rod-binding protein [Candidatus Terasakiella magnetica]SCA57876.1 Chemotactic signal-response protein CheL (modular protein) [Candidatus Terasakiella magnetica]
MSDLSIMSQAQMALQQAQSQQAMAGLDQPKKQDADSFAKALSSQQMKDPSFMEAHQRRKIRETAVDFEAQFLSQMLQPMFEGLNATEPFGGGHAEKMWQGMLVNEYGSSLAKSGGIGLADEVERQLLRAQEGL